MVKRLMIVIVCLMFVVACGPLQLKPTVIPEGCEDSLIYSKLPYPQVTDTVLQVAVYQFAIETGSAPQILDVINTIEAALVSPTGMNFSDFVLLVNEQVGLLNARWGVSLLIVSESLADLSVPIPISECDKNLLLKHLAKQKKWVALAG